MKEVNQQKNLIKAMKTLVFSIMSAFIFINGVFAQTNTILTGNVGIGTTNPTEKLNISAGTLLFSGEYGNFEYGSIKFSYPAWPAAWAGITGKTNGQGWDQVDLVFNTAFGGSTEKMRILAQTGDVGIGTSTPHAKLDVNGNVFIGTSDANTATQIADYSLAVNGTAVFNKAKVSLYGNWPDYVFSPSYKLTPLDSLEQFIMHKGHLPEMPNAEEVAKNGIDLGNNQALLLKKIEELTLFAIEQNKQSEKLRNITEEQAKQCENLQKIIEEQNQKYRVQSEKISELEKKLNELENKLNQ